MSVGCILIVGIPWRPMMIFDDFLAGRCAINGMFFVSDTFYFWAFCSSSFWGGAPLCAWLVENRLNKPQTRADCRSCLGYISFAQSKLLVAQQNTRPFANHSCLIRLVTTSRPWLGIWIVCSRAGSYPPDLRENSTKTTQAQERV